MPAWNASPQPEYQSPTRHVKATVNVYDESQALLYTWTSDDRLISVSIERVGDETKFFGYTICQKATVKLIDKERELSLSTACCLEIIFDAGEHERDASVCSAFPRFFVSRNTRDENTNELTITAYDALHQLSKYTVSDLGVMLVPTIEYFTRKIAQKIGLSLSIFECFGSSTPYQSLEYPDGFNFDGTESLWDALNAAAEAMQSVCYVLPQRSDASETTTYYLSFKRLSTKYGNALTIGKSDYFTLENSDNRRLQKIVSVTELGDNVSAETTQAGTTIYIRDNPFLDNRDDVAEILEAAIADVGDLTINQFECTWRGNPYLRIGDRIGLVTKDDQVVYSYLLDDAIEYNGTLTEKTRWHYSASDAETADNPSSLGEAIKATFARVDKVSRQIDLVASSEEETKEQLAQISVKVDEIDNKVENLDFGELGDIQTEIANLKVTSEEISQQVQTLTESDETQTSEIASLKLTDDSIIASVENVEQNVNSSIDSMNGSIETITHKLSTTVTTENISVAIQNEIANGGVTSVTTKTGFTFDEVGLTIDKLGTEMSTTITEDGMTVYRDDNPVLIADNVGVKAENLHATTYLIIGNYTRFEDYVNDDNEPRTGCFWIGKSGGLNGNTDN